MKTFAETQKGKKAKKKPAEKDDKEEEEKEPPLGDSPSASDVIQAREALKRRLNGTPQKSQPTELVTPSSEEKKETFQRKWVTVSDKVDKKAMDSVDVSLVKNDGSVNLEAEMSKYLGGDDEVLAGFFNSDDEPEGTINVADGKQQTSSKGFFGKITSAFQQITGNKVLTHDDMGPILVDFAKALMDKNVA